MIAVFLLAGVFIAGSIAWAGLVRGSLSASKNKEITGSPAKIIGLLCLLLSLGMLIGAAALFGAFRV